MDGSVIPYLKPISGDVIDVRCECGFKDPCPRHVLTDLEIEARDVLWEKVHDLGSEGFGGFYAGQAEEVLLVLRQAGFRLVKP
jgi:hypothetical protein